MGDGISTWSTLTYYGINTGSESGTVSSVAGKTGAVTLVASDIGGLATVATSGSYTDLTNKPVLSTVATTGSYSDLLNTPTLATVATSGAYADLSGTPTLAAVATSGSYTDLSNTPTIPAAQVNSDWTASSGVAQILNKPTLATVATSGAYTDLTGLPTIPGIATTSAAGTVQPDGTTISIENGVISAVQIPEFTPTNTLYVAPNGSASNPGTAGEPFALISQALAASAGSSTLIYVYPGSYNDTIVINNQQVAIMTLPAAGTYSPVSITGSISINTNQSGYFGDFNMSQTDSSVPCITVTGVNNTGGFRFGRVTIAGLAGADTVVINQTNQTGVSNGSVIFDDLSVTKGNINLSGWYTVAKNMSIDGVVVINVSGGTSELTNIWSLGSINHTGGVLALTNVRSLGNNNATTATLTSTASGSTDGLKLTNVSTWTSATTQAFVNKTGSCAYVLNDFTYNLANDVWTGTQVVSGEFYDLDVYASYTGQNYTGVANQSIVHHFTGIDNALGTINTSLATKAVIVSTVPASTTATGTPGQIASDTQYVYICVATNSWIRIAIDNTWGS